jgi:dihydroorotase
MVNGVKVRMSENVIAKHGLEPLNRAVRACELSGVPAKIMCHIGGVSDRALMSKILDVLRSGDVLTHCFSGAPNIDGEGTNILQDGKLLPAALGMPYLPWVMSKFLGMGFSLSEVVSMATQVPARVIGRVPKHETLQIGAPADLSVLELVEGAVEFVDTRNNKRKGNMFLRPSGTIVAGVAFGRSYQSPFSAR